MIPIIFDTDPGVDDITALLFAHAHPDIEIAGVTTVFGNADIDTVTRNAAHVMGRFGIAAPLAKGAGTALRRVSVPPPAHIHGANGMGNVHLPATAPVAVDARPAHRMIIDLVRARPGEIELVAVGRMTNLALALAEAPEVAGLVRGVTIMGGAFGVGGPNGNVTPVAEANIIGDPHAADIVFSAGWRVRAIGLDVTRQTILDAAGFDRLAEGGGEAGRFIAAISAGYAAYHERFGVAGCYVHDSSAIAAVVAPDLFRLRQGPVRVVADGIAEGQTIQRDPETFYPPGDWDDSPHQSVAVAVDGPAVVDLLLESLCAPGSRLG